MVMRQSHIGCSRGFTLIELSIVLVIIGILISLGAGMTGPLMNFIKVRETRDAIDANLQSVISWAASHNKLPRSSDFVSAVAKTSTDAWGQPLLFAYYTSLAPTSATKDTICGRRSTFFNISTLSPKVSVRNVAFAVFSRADNSEFKSKLNGVTITSGAVDAGGGTITSSEPVSDIVSWVTLDELRSKAGCQGAQLRIVNNELPFGAVTSDYSVTLSADGGVPFSPVPATFKWCVSTALADGTPAALSSKFVLSGGISNDNCMNLPETAWGAESAGLTISFSAADPVLKGAYKLAVTVRDKADGNAGSSTSCSSAGIGDSCVQKIFVLTVNPQ